LAIDFSSTSFANILFMLHIMIYIILDNDIRYLLFPSTFPYKYATAPRQTLTIYDTDRICFSGFPLDNKKKGHTTISIHEWHNIYLHSFSRPAFLDLSVIVVFSFPVQHDNEKCRLFNDARIVLNSQPSGLFQFAVHTLLLPSLAVIAILSSLTMFSCAFHAWTSHHSTTISLNRSVIDASVTINFKVHCICETNNSLFA
jgi:hypothetical protein